jgi:hypothetical protein
MLTKKVTDDDHFMSLSASAQALYLHLSMAADDDGFCNQVAVCMFKAHASTSDLEALLSNRYIYQFENGVIVIKHWRMANALRKDRYSPTVFQKEYAMLDLKDNGSYTMRSEPRLEEAGCQVVAKRLPDGCPNISKDKLSKVKISKDTLAHPKVSGVVEETPFDIFWKAYPRKTGKGDARKKFAKALTKTSFENIMAALGKVKASAQWQKDDGQFVPYPATWLNQERWDDEVGQSADGLDNLRNLYAMAKEEEENDQE